MSDTTIKTDNTTANVNPTGVYVIQWEQIDEDGHTESGVHAKVYRSRSDAIQKCLDLAYEFMDEAREEAEGTLGEDEIFREEWEDGLHQIVHDGETTFEVLASIHEIA